MFDSGIGGLTVFRELRRRLPGETLLYLGDTARVPYGTKSAETVHRFSREAVEFLLARNVRLIVVACNTVSAVALEKLQTEFSVPLVGVVIPGARGAVRKTKNRKIGVIGTEGTIRSGAYEREIKKLNPAAEVTSTACPLFVPFVEEGWLEGEATRLVADRYLTSLKKTGIDTLILGCTHYPLLKPVIQEALPNIVLVDSAEETATQVAPMLKPETGEKGEELFFVTDTPERFRRVGEIFLGRGLKNVTHVEI